MFLSPKNVVDYSDVHIGMKVADFGAGVGHYSIPLAERVGKTGAVYAIDVQNDLLNKLSKDAEDKKLDNLHVIWGDIDEVGGSKLADASVDRVFLTNTLFQIEKKDNLAKEIYRVLKPNGKLILIDWSESFGGLGPRPIDVVTEESAKDIFAAAKFVAGNNIKAGDHHYGIIFGK